MNWNFVGGLSVALWFAVSITVYRRFYRISKIRQVRGTERALMIGMMFASALPILAVAGLRESAEWKQLAFQGVISAKRETGNHAMLEYSITDSSAKTTVVLDRKWKLKDFKVGDSVRKAKGADEAQRLGDHAP